MKGSVGVVCCHRVSFGVDVCVSWSFNIESYDGVLTVQFWRWSNRFGRVVFSFDVGDCSILFAACLWFRYHHIFSMLRT